VGIELAMNCWNGGALDKSEQQTRASKGAVKNNIDKMKEVQ
jgi:hypothetical protein